MTNFQVIGMNRRELFKSMPFAMAASRLKAQSDAKYRLKAGLVAYSFRKQLEARAMKYEDLIRYVSDLGLDGLDTTVYWFPDTSDQFLASLRRIAYKNAVSLYSLGVRVRLCQPTLELQRAEVENAKKWVDVAEKLGASHVRVLGGSVPKGAGEPQAIAWAVEVLKRSAEYAGNKGILLGLENDAGLTASAKSTVEIVQQANSPWVGVNLDTGNFPIDGYRQISSCIPHALNVHIKPYIAGADGTREKADWDRLLETLGQGGYKGYLSLEYEEKEDPGAAVPVLAAELRRCVQRHST
jgi:sugar phosphate isomerase/epimerase